MQKRVAGLSAIVLVVASDLLLWRAGIAQLNAGVDRWIARARQQGWTVSSGLPQAGGWPSAASLAFPNVRITGGARTLPGGIGWQAPRIVLSVSMFHPATLAIVAEGHQQLRLSHVHTLVFMATQMLAEIPLWGARQPAAELWATGIVGGIAGSGHPQDVQVASLHLTLAGAALDGRSFEPAPNRLDLTASGIGLPDIGRWPLGATVASVGASVAMEFSHAGPQSPKGVTAPPPGIAADPESQARAWRDDGGRLVVHNGELHWGPLALTGHADLALDADLQPSGSFSADVTGSAATLDALASGGVIAPGMAKTGQAVLALMAPVGPDAVRLPFILRDSTISIGRIPVIRIAGLRWRGAR